MSRHEHNQNDRGTEDSDYPTSPAPSSNTSYSADFNGILGQQSSTTRQLPSVAAYQRALAELMASTTIRQQSNDVDRRQGKMELQGSGKGSTLRHGGSEMTTSPDRGEQLTTDSDRLLTAPTVSLSPVERVSLT